MGIPQATVQEGRSALTVATGGVVVDQNADERDFGAYFASQQLGQLALGLSTTNWVGKH